MPAPISSNEILYPHLIHTDDIVHIIKKLAFIPPIPEIATSRDSALERKKIRGIFFENEVNGSYNSMVENITSKRRAIGLSLRQFSLPNYPHSNLILPPSLLPLLPHRILFKTIGISSVSLFISEDQLPQSYQWEYDPAFYPFGFARKKNSEWNVITSHEHIAHNSLTDKQISSLVCLDFFTSVESLNIHPSMIKNQLSEWINTQPREQILKHIKIIPS